MPQTEVHFYREASGKVPVRDWLEELQRTDAAAAAKSAEAIRRLAAHGYELRRPYADMLRDAIYELRVRVRRVNYRILYFFHGRNVVVLAHALTKEQAVPKAEIEKALKRKQEYESDPQKHRETVEV